MNTLTAILPLAAIAAGTEISLTLVWILMLVVGFVLAVVEIYMPGFGAPGIIGTVLLIGGILLCARGNVTLSLILLGVIVALLAVVLSLSIRSAARGRLQKSDLVLHEAEAPSVSLQDLSFYVNKEGTALTVLRPAGIGEFDGVKLNVVSEGDFISEGAPIRVRHVEGNRIIVIKA